MRIAVIGAKGLPPRQGGVEHYCAEVFPRIVEKGHCVELFAQAQYTGFGWGEQYDFHGVQVITLPSLGMNGVDTFFGSALASLLSTRERYDIVHFHALGPGLFSLIPRLAGSAKIVVTCHGLDWQREKWGRFSRRLIRWGETTTVRCAHEIVVVSADLQSYFLKTYQRQTTFIPNAPAEYVPSDPTHGFIKSLGAEPGKYILFVGRLVPEKCPDLLIQAFQKLQSRQWKLILVGGNGGSDAFASRLYHLAANNSNIIFTGELRGARLAEVVRGAGLFILPSNLEGSPLAMLEAMREAIPVIASNIAPHVELIQDNRGLLFEKGNVESLQASLRWAFVNPLEMHQMAERAQANVLLHHSWNHVTTEMMSLYESLCSWSAQPSYYFRRN